MTETELNLTADDRRAIDLFDSICRLADCFGDLAAQGERDAGRKILRAMDRLFGELRELKPRHKRLARNIAAFIAGYDEGWSSCWISGTRSDQGEVA